MSRWLDLRKKTPGGGGEIVRFTGEEEREATIVIADKKITVDEGHVGEPDLHVTADAQTWIGFLRQERNIVWALLRRKVRLKGPLKLLLAFGKCFPR